MFWRPLRLCSLNYAAWDGVESSCVIVSSYVVLLVSPFVRPCEVSCSTVCACNRAGLLPHPNVILPLITWNSRLRYEACGTIFGNYDVDATLILLT